jgi:hypothetical protein
MIENLKQQLSILLQILGLQKQIEVIQGNPAVILDKARSLLGQDASPQNLAPKEYACAESVSSVLNSLWPEIPVVTGTYTLWNYLNTSPLFYKSDGPADGCVIIAPTGTGIGVGHTGIVDGDKVMSNNSATGLWDKHITLKSWAAYFKGRLPTYYFIKN